MNQDFYISCPSNTPAPGNTTHDFSVPLHSPLIFKKPYKVGLAQISIPISFKPFDNAKNRAFGLTIFDNTLNNYIFNEVLFISNNFYSNADEIIENINQVIGDLDQIKQISVENRIKLEYFDHSRTIKVSASDQQFRQEIRFLPYLAHILGFDSAVSYPNSDSNSGTTSLFHSSLVCIIYVLLDIISPEFVGVPLTLM